MSLAANLQVLLVPFALLVCRFGGLFLALPVFSTQAAPRTMRVALSVTLAIAFVSAMPHAVFDLPVSALAFAAVSEVVLGYAVGFVARLVIGAIEFAAELAGMQMGFGFAQTMDPLTRQSSGPVTQLMTICGGLMFLAVGGHHLVLRAMSQLLRVVPLGTVTDLSGPWMLRTVDLGGEVFLSGVRIAAPLLFVAFATHVIFGLLTRVAPQLNVWALGFLFSIFIGLVAMILLSPVLGEELEVLVGSGLRQGLLLFAEAIGAP